MASSPGLAYQIHLFPMFVSTDSRLHSCCPEHYLPCHLASASSCQTAFGPPRFLCASHRTCNGLFPPEKKRENRENDLLTVVPAVVDPMQKLAACMTCIHSGTKRMTDDCDPAAKNGAYHHDLGHTYGGTRPECVALRGKGSLKTETRLRCRLSPSCSKEQRGPGALQARNAMQTAASMNRSRHPTLRVTLHVSAHVHS